MFLQPACGCELYMSHLRAKRVIFPLQRRLSGGVASRIFIMVNGAGEKAMVRTIAVFALLSFVGGEGFAQTARVPVISPAERAAIFKAGGAVLRGGKWLGCADAPSPEPAPIALYKDLHGHRRQQAVAPRRREEGREGE